MPKTQNPPKNFLKILPILTPKSNNKPMKKIVLIITLTLLVGSLLFASEQANNLYVGAKLGATVNSVIAGENYRRYKYHDLTGTKVAVPVIYQATNYFGLESGIALTTKNYNLVRTVKEDMVNLKIENGFITVPLSLNFSLPLDDVFSMFLNVGGYVGWWCYGKSEGKVIDIVRKQQDVSEASDLSLKNRLEYGLMASLGVSYNIENVRLILSAEFEKDLSDMNKKQEVGAYQIYNSTVAFSTSLLWRVK